MNSDGHSSLFRPHPAPGQWWAPRTPAGLLRVTTVYVNPGFFEVSGHLWDYTNHGVLWSYSLFNLQDYEYLWFEDSFECKPEESHCFGQAYVSAMNERIFFIAPDADPGRTKILASWPVSETLFRKATLYQDIGLPRASTNGLAFYARELLAEPFG